MEFGVGRVISLRQVGGLHHRYELAPPEATHFEAGPLRIRSPRSAPAFQDSVCSRIFRKPKVIISATISNHHSRGGATIPRGFEFPIPAHPTFMRSASG